MLNKFFHSRKKRIATKINEMVTQIGGKVIRLDYYPEMFGNIRLSFEKEDKIYEYAVDRGDIYLNNKLVCDDSYIREENKYPYQKLIEIIVSTID